MRKGMIALAMTTGLAGIVATTAVVGCEHQRTPAGHEGYVYHDPLLFGSRHYTETIQGPGSTGLVWRDYVINIDMRPTTHSEEYKILTKDNLELSFRSHAKISLKEGSVRDVVETLGAQNWYKNNVMEQYRTAVHEEVRKYDAYTVKDKSQEISENILQRLRKEYEKTPVQFESMSIGSIDYPDSVNAEIEKKVAAQQRLERMHTEEDIAERQAAIRVKDAEGLAKAQSIINDTLTPLYIQHEAIEAYAKLAQSPNTTFVIVPTNPNGSGIPMILGSPETKSSK